MSIPEAPTLTSSAPCTKRRYPTKRDAATARNQRLYGRRQKRRGRPAYLRIYPCPHCHGWHLTHQPRNRK